MRKKLIILIFIALITQSIYANQTEVKKFEYNFSVGPSIPLFYYYFNSNGNIHNQGFYFGKNTNLTLGANACLNINYKFDKKLSIGATAGYNLNKTTSNAFYSLIPIGMKIIFTPFILDNFEFPISFNLGASINSFRTNTNILPYFSLRLGGTYFFNQGFGIGINSGVELIPTSFFDQAYLNENSIYVYIPVNLIITIRS